MVTAAKLVRGYCNRLVRLDDERLAKQALARNLELGGLAARQREATAPWGGQVHPLLAAAHSACDLVRLCEVDVKGVISALDCRHMESPLGSKAVRSVKVAGSLDRQRCTTPALYLQMVTKWADCKQMAQVRTGPHWLAKETGQWAGLGREQCQCQRSQSGAVK